MNCSSAYNPQTRESTPLWYDVSLGSRCICFCFPYSSSDNNVFSLTVPPTIKIPDGYGHKTIPLGSTTEFLKCKATGIPKPTITWKNPAGETVDVENDDRFTIINDTLLIKPTRKEDKGIWWCYARNPFGSQSLGFSFGFLPCKYKHSVQ